MYIITLRSSNLKKVQIHDKLLILLQLIATYKKVEMTTISLTREHLRSVDYLCFEKKNQTLFNSELKKAITKVFV